MTSLPLVSTLVAPPGASLSQADIGLIAQRITQSDGDISRISRIDARAVDIFFSGDSVIDISGLHFDVLTQSSAMRRKKFLIADMESTIIAQEMLDELADHIGVGERVADITRRAMNGELDFAAALTERVGLLKGQPESLLRQVAESMTWTPGAYPLVKAVQAAGGKAWLVSGGFGFFVKIVAQQIGFDRYFSNELKLEGDVLSGEIIPPLLDKDSKKMLLERACGDYGCTLAETLAVGDGANDVPMLQACVDGGGLGVAYHAKPRVREVIHNQINHGDLSALIYAVGLV